MKSKEDLRQGAVEGRGLLKALLAFALPLIATSLLQLIFNTADTVMVGRFGGTTPEASAAQMAAVGSCTPLVNLFTNAALGLSVGCGITVAYRSSKGRAGELAAVVHTGIALAAVLGILILAVGLPLATPILQAMDTDAAILADAVDYLRVYLVGMPACVVYNFAAAILRAKGDTVRPLIFLAIGGGVNVGLNAVTVVGFGMGAFGVGLATAVSQWLSCILILVYLARAEGEYRLRLSSLRIGRDALLAILGAGIPAAAQSLLFNFSAVILQSAVNGFGPAVVAGNTAALNVEGYIYTTQNALYHTATMFIARERGACNLVGIGRIKRASAATVAVIGVVVGWGVLLLATPILSLYAPGNPQAVEAGLVRLIAVCPLYFLCGLMEVGTGALRGMGRSLLPTATSLIGCCLLRILWVVTVFRALSPSLADGEALFLLYLCFPLSWLLTAAAQHLLASRELARLGKKALST